MSDSRSKTLSTEQVDQLARQLRAQVLAREKRVPHSRAKTGSVAEAYQVQRAYQRLLTDEGLGEIVGYKIALTSQTMQEMVGVNHPLAGAIFESVVEPGGGSIRLADFVRIGLEFEIAVKLKQDLGPRGGGHDIDSVAEAVASVAPAFELVEDRNADYDNIDAYSLIAENCWNAGVVVGDFTENYNVATFADTATTLELNGTAMDHSVVGDAMGHPFAVVAWVANLLLDQGRRLESGMIVMTGSSMKTRFPTTGDEFKFTVDGLGAVSITAD